MLKLKDTFFTNKDMGKALSHKREIKCVSTDESDYFLGILNRFW